MALDLFKLFGTIEIDNSKANKALDDTSDKGNKTESKLSAAFSKVGSAAVKIGKTVSVGMAAAGTAVAGLVTKSVQSYADYEQLVGGVETLFKESAGKVQEYAANAYKTAGLSANEYMETVTSFSASLLQSLGGDTDKAAEVADMAITDMSDNANKMGTSMELIQNAYNGFAKGNFTMLDNLKLGYGGTKEEMQRLLDKAGEISGIEYDISSFGDIANAIHVIQQEMEISGISYKEAMERVASGELTMEEATELMGTTAKEAASTISGSIGMMKASWSNLITGMSNENADFSGLVNNFVNSVSTVTDNLMPRIEIALKGVVQLINQLAPVIIGAVPELFAELLPAIISAATSMISSLVSALPGIVSALTSALVDVFDGVFDIMKRFIFNLGNIVSAIVPSLPDIASGLIDLFLSAFSMLAQEIPYMIEPILAMLPDLLTQIADIVNDASWELIDYVIYMIHDVVAMIPQMLPQILSAIQSIVQTIVNDLPDLLSYLVEGTMMIVDLLVEQIPVLIPMLVDVIVSLINSLAEQIPVIIPILVEALVQIVTMITEQLPVIIPMLIEATITIVMALVDALPTIITALVDALPAILQAVWDAIVMVFENLPEWFGQIWEGAVEIVKGIVEPIVEWFGGIWDSMKSNPALADLCASIENIWDEISGYISTVVEFLKTFIPEAWEAIKNAVTVFVTAIKESVKENWDSIKAAIDSVISAIKTVIESGWNTIKTIVSNVMKMIKSIFSGDWEGVKQSIKNIINAIKEYISTSWNAIKSALSSVMNAIKNVVSGVWDRIGDSVMNVVNKVKSFLSSAWDGIKTTATKMWNDLPDKITKPIEKARDTIKGIVDKIKGFFTGMKIEFPKIKLPHFGIEPEGWSIGDLLDGEIPHLSIDWYAKAMDRPMIMTRPTIFGYDAGTGQLMGGGETGSEVVTGTNTLMGMIRAAVAAQNEAVIAVLTAILNAILGGNEELVQAILADKSFAVGEREFARLVKQYA